MVHIQDFENANVEPHWGYADRVIPCTNDAGSCAYLDATYGAHDVGMTYVGIMWLVIGGVLLVWALHRRLTPGPRGKRAAAVRALLNRWLLPNAAPARPGSARRAVTAVFGHATRLQVLLVLGMLAYLAVFSFVGITYATWVTPVKGSDPPVHNTRTSLGPWADRVGVLAYALTPLSVLLGARESLLSALTGVPYQQFTFLHRWVGHVIFAQSALHTIGWCVVEIRLYQPQPRVAAEWIVQTYMVWGVVAMALLLLLWFLATPWGQRLTGYETFRKAHYVLAMVYIGACWGHWDGLRCFLLPSLLLWGADRALRLLRTALLHHRVIGAGAGTGAFAAFPARITPFRDAARLDVDVAAVGGRAPAAPGQHYYVTFPRGSVWQSHPLTPLSASGNGAGLAFVVRARAGETRRVLALAPETPVLLTGPYGPDISAPRAASVLCIAGGTGIAFVLPVLLAQACAGPVQLVWCVRARADVAWVAPELAQLRAARVSVTVHVTREQDTEKTAASASGTSTPGQSSTTHTGASATAELAGLETLHASATATATPAETPEPAAEKAFALEHPDAADAADAAAADAGEGAALTTGAGAGAGERYAAGRCCVERVVGAFLDKTAGHVRVYVSGPAAMVAEARHAVARRADPAAARAYGDDVEFFYDERLD